MKKSTFTRRLDVGSPISRDFREYDADIARLKKQSKVRLSFKAETALFIVVMCITVATIVMA